MVTRNLTHVSMLDIISYCFDLTFSMNNIHYGIAYLNNYIRLK